MLNTVILKNNYQDSINLMLLTNTINNLDGVAMSQIMMGTDANKDILNNTGLLIIQKQKRASPNDMMIVVDSENETNYDNRFCQQMDAFSSSDLSANQEMTKRNPLPLLGKKH
jgi:hypothetical protein